MKAWDCITFRSMLILGIWCACFCISSLLQPARLHIWRWVGKITKMQRLKVALNQKIKQAVPYWLPVFYEKYPIQSLLEIGNYFQSLMLFLNQLLFPNWNENISITFICTNNLRKQQKHWATSVVFSKCIFRLQVLQSSHPEQVFLMFSLTLIKRYWKHN